MRQIRQVQKRKKYFVSILLKITITKKHFFTLQMQDKIVESGTKAAIKQVTGVSLFTCNTIGVQPNLTTARPNTCNARESVLSRSGFSMQNQNVIPTQAKTTNVVKGYPMFRQGTTHIQMSHTPKTHMTAALSSRGRNQASFLGAAQSKSFQSVSISSAKNLSNTFGQNSTVLRSSIRAGNGVTMFAGQNLRNQQPLTPATPSLLSHSSDLSRMPTFKFKQRGQVKMSASNSTFEQVTEDQTLSQPPKTLDQRERDACGVGFIANLKSEPSHDILKAGIQALECNDHRGGCNYDGVTGDGSGLMTTIPWQLLQKWADQEKLGKIDPNQAAVGMFFLNPDEQEAARKEIEQFVDDSKFTMIGWRHVPVQKKVLGKLALENVPDIWQLVLDAPGLDDDQIEVQAYSLRRQVSKHLDEKFGKLKHYSVSLSNKTIIYKGMVLSAALANFYEDLQNEDFKTTFALYHRRYSTNTLPRWQLAQPFRTIGHNGEINTFLGNINWARARDQQYESDRLDEIMEDIVPVCSTQGSDSAALDNMVELYIKNGYTPQKALMLLIPEAFHKHPSMDTRQEVRDFYEYHAGMQEPWDGPANVTFCDGNILGACLDRNGLRPARYEITHDDMIYFGSEVGSNQLSEDRIKKKGRLGPGQMFAVDLRSGDIMTNWQLKEKIAKENPYGDWIKENRINVVTEEEDYQDGALEEADEVMKQQAAFGISAEDVEVIITPMSVGGKEPVFSMGEDTPLPFLTERPRVMHDYFKQRFAQVTNPPIDSLREGVVMSLDTYLGAKGNILKEDPEHARQIKLESPVLTEANLEEVMQGEIEHKEISLLYPSDGSMTMEEKLAQVCDEAAEAVKNGQELVVISDKGMQADKFYVPALLATGAIHHRLIKDGLRLQGSIIVNTAQCWSTHHYATLIGYGASAVCPYLTWETIRQEFLVRKVKKGEENLTMLQVQKNYRKAIDNGLLKILSKMGISLLSSYQGAQIFEIIGLSQSVVDVAFKGTASQVGGLTMGDLEKEMTAFKDQAYDENLRKLVNAGFFRDKPGGEYHFNSKTMVKNLHKALEDKDYDHYKLYEEELSKRPPTALRDLLTFDSKRDPVPVDDVEEVAEICKRFFTGGMSLGALSPEAHETIAIAMNRIGGMSNSGEGGEDRKRFLTINDVTADGKSLTFPHLNGLKNGDIANSGIKQVASGRFGVTAEYLQSAKQIEIKIAQGAKPGEGGQLPGAKVSEYIAGLRYSKPGVTLISPPPHHDIYSIEDLVQLIYDLHEVNPAAKVSVKLVAEVGIGTIASGVAKANADVIQISGHEGGTGASPISSLKHAGGLWELGLAETHAALQENKLRDRVALRVDGGLRAGWEVVMAAILGANEFGFGSIAMIAEGCVMARVCHLNSCPVGIATQKEELRKRFSGTPENVVDFFFYLAQEVRETMAHLGYTKIDDLIGQTHLLKQKDIPLFKASDVNLGVLLNRSEEFMNQDWLEKRSLQAHSNGPVLDDDVLADPAFQTALSKCESYSTSLQIRNQDRAVATRVAGAIAREHGDKGLAEAGATVELAYKGSAGQSFGAFCIPGLQLNLEGQANDYVGKSMCGGTISIRPDSDFTGESNSNVIIGNTCVYGANGGQMFASGRAGERLAVRNSGCHVVVEGSGDHCCEYMTDGRVVVLGGVGRNCGAGMTGGLAYIMDNGPDIEKRINSDVRIQRIQTQAASDELKQLIAAFTESTGSRLGQMILDNFESYIPQFWQVIPPSEDNSVYTHDIPESVAEPVGSMAGSRPASANKPRASVAMQAEPFQVQDKSRSSPRIDQNYWGKKLQ